MVTGQQQLAPRLYLKIGGSNASEQVTDAIVSVEVDDSLTLPDMFSIHLRDPNLEWIDADTFSLGTEVEISAGRENQETTILKGEITGIEPRLNREMGPTIMIRGFDKSHRLNRGRKTKSYQQMTDSDIAQSVAQDNSLRCQADSTSQVREYVLQDNQTDWEFLISRAERVGYRVLVEDDTLHFVQFPDSGAQTPTLEWADELLEFNARLSSARQVSEVIVQGWNPEQQEQIVGRATQPNDTPQIGESRQGGAATQSAFGAASEIVVDRPVFSQAEADTLAQAVCDEIGQGFIEAECVAVGNAAIQAGVNIRLDGLGNRFSGTYRVTHALHRYDRDGYKTRFTVGGRHTATITELFSKMQKRDFQGPVVGVVTNIDDPNDQCRVRVRIPSLKDDEESHWARLVATGAGDGRGIQWIPEVGDEVLVVFQHGDIHHPYVVGGFWSGQNAPVKPNSQCTSSGTVNERIIQSRSGHLIILGDEDGSEKITIKDMTGNNQIVIDSASNSITVNADQDVTIEAQGKITVKSTNSDLAFEGNNCEFKTNQNFKIQATGSCEIKSTQNCTMEGTAGLTVKNAAAQIQMSGPTINMNNGALEVM